MTHADVPAYTPFPALPSLPRSLLQRRHLWGAAPAQRDRRSLPGQSHLCGPQPAVHRPGAPRGCSCPPPAAAVALPPRAAPPRLLEAGSRSALIPSPACPSPLLSARPQVSKFRIQAIREDGLVLEQARELSLSAPVAAGAAGLQLAFEWPSGAPQRLKFRVAATDGAFAGPWSAESETVTVGEWRRGGRVWEAGGAVGEQC